MQVRPIQNNFTAGEFSPRLESRIDLPKYGNACKTLENFLVWPHGGAYRRPGFHYAAGVKDHTRKVRLIPFEFNTEQAYVLEFGHQYMRVFKNHGQVLTSADSYTKLLLHMDGPHDSTDFVDSSPSEHTVTAFGNAKLTTLLKVFGQSSASFDGDGDYLRIDDHADFDFSGGIWTIDARVAFFPTPTGHKIIYCQCSDAGNYIVFWIEGAVAPYYLGTLRFAIYSGGSPIVELDSGAQVTSYLWHHAAVVENGDSYYLFLDGNLVDSTTDTDRPANYTGYVFTGAFPDEATYFRGCIDELRVSKGVARWTSNFSPPTQQYPLPGESTAVEVTANYPFTEADLAAIRKAQSADVMHIVHGVYPPRKLSRTSHTNWTFTLTDFIDGPYRDEEATPTITPSATTGNITLTASAALFYSGHVGALWRIKHGSTWGYVKITGVTDTTHADATVKNTLGGTGASDGQCEGAWSNYRGWPTAVMFHENRLWFARDLTFWASRKGNDLWEDFTPGTTDEDPLAFSVASDRVNLIRWMASSSALIIGTAGEEFRAKGTDGFITATNIDSKSATTQGVADVEPLRIGSAVLFLQRAGQKIHELVYSYDIDGYVAPDLTLLAEHITNPKILSLTYQQEPNSTVWAVRSDGVLLSMTYMRPEDVVAWTRHITDGEVESITCIPNPDGSANELWISVKREINGEIKRYIEYMDPDLQVDSGLTYSGAPVTSLSGLDHLEGETVKVVGDGMVFNDAVVSGGAITLDPAYAASEIQAGLWYQHKLETMRPEVSLGNGTSRGLKKAWGDCFVSLLESGGLTVNGELIPFGFEYGKAVDLFTGDKQVNQLGWDRNEGRITIEGSQPLPCTVLAIFGNLEIGG